MNLHLEGERIMGGTTMSRRNLLRAGAAAMAGAGVLRAATARAWGGAARAAENASSMTKEEIIRSYYTGGEKKDWSAIDRLLGESFTFTSPNDDDHINKTAFKARCWSQADWIKRFELENVIGKGDEVFVKYLCRTKNDKSFRNIEYFRFKDGKVEAIEVYFGGDAGFPSAASKGHR